MEFQCSSCGLCCKKVGKAVNDARKWMRENKGKKPDDVTKAKAKFPFKFKENGACEKQGEDGKCTVYETRPDICNVEKSFGLFFKGEKAEYFTSNAKLCNTWIRKAGLGMDFLVTEKY